MSVPPTKHDHGQSEIWKRPELVASVKEAMTAVAYNLLVLRKRQGLSQERLAELAGLHAKHIQRLEKAAKNTTVATIAALAKALEVPIGTLFRKPRK